MLGQISREIDCDLAVFKAIVVSFDFDRLWTLTGFVGGRFATGTDTFGVLSGHCLLLCLLKLFNCMLHGF